MILPADAIDELLDRHYSEWRRRRALVLINVIAASLLVGAIVGGLVWGWLR